MFTRTIIFGHKRTGTSLPGSQLHPLLLTKWSRAVRAATTPLFPDESLEIASKLDAISHPTESLSAPFR